ncbi:hypothetical protein ABPG75_000804 [Micractinium tetrahymenae]
MSVCMMHQFVRGNVQLDVWRLSRRESCGWPRLRGGGPSRLLNFLHSRHSCYSLALISGFSIMKANLQKLSAEGVSNALLDFPPSALFNPACVAATLFPCRSSLAIVNQMRLLGEQKAEGEAGGSDPPQKRQSTGLPDHANLLVKAKSSDPALRAAVLRRYRLEVLSLQNLDQSPKLATQLEELGQVLAAMLGAVLDPELRCEGKKDKLEIDAGMKEALELVVAVPMILVREPSLARTALDLALTGIDAGSAADPGLSKLLQEVVKTIVTCTDCFNPEMTKLVRRKLQGLASGSTAAALLRGSLVELVEERMGKHFEWNGMRRAKDDKWLGPPVKLGRAHTAGQAAGGSSSTATRASRKEVAEAQCPGP